MATISFTCGAEATSEFGHWDDLQPANGAVTVDATHVLSGTSAIKITNQAYLQYEFPVGKRFWAVRMSVWLPSTPTVVVRLLEVNDGDQHILTWEVSTGKLAWYDGTTSTLVFPLDQWVTIDLSIDSSVNPHVAAWNINGVTQPAPSTDPIAAQDMVRMFLGSGNTGTTYSRWFDDVAVSFLSADYPIPNGFAIGSPEAWTNGVPVILLGGL